MGAGASASEQNELRAAFAEFDPSMSHEDCRVLLEKHAPTLMARTIQGSTEGGDNSSIMAAVAALHDQFTMAHHKLRGGGQGQNAGENSGGATSTADVAEAAELAAARLVSMHDWAADKQTNIQKGLIAGTLRSTQLRLVRFTVGQCAAQESANGLGGGGGDDDKGDNGNAPDCSEPWFAVGMIDSGAERSGMSPRAAYRLGLTPRLLDDSFSRTVTGVGMSRGHGRVHFCEIRFDEKGDAKGSASSPLFVASFDIFDWPPNATEFDAIIGLDFLLRYGASLDFSANILTLNLQPEEATAEKARTSRYSVHLCHDAEAEQKEKNESDTAKKAAIVLS